MCSGPGAPPTVPAMGCDRSNEAPSRRERVGSAAGRPPMIPPGCTPRRAVDRSCASASAAAACARKAGAFTASCGAKVTVSVTREKGGSVPSRGDTRKCGLATGTGGAARGAVPLLLLPLPPPARLLSPPRVAVPSRAVPLPPTLLPPPAPPPVLAAVPARVEVAPAEPGRRPAASAGAASGGFFSDVMRDSAALTDAMASAVASRLAAMAPCAVTMLPLVDSDSASSLPPVAPTSGKPSCAARLKVTGAGPSFSSVTVVTADWP